VYLQTWAREIYELTPAQIDILTTIAVQNPVEGGVAVYLARIMLDMVIDDELPESQSRLSFAKGVPNSQKSLNCKLIQNPVENIIRISCYEDIKYVNSITLYNNLGQLVARWNNLASQNGQFEIPINGLTQGLYTIVLINEKSVYNDKIVVQ